MFLNMHKYQNVLLIFFLHHAEAGWIHLPKSQIQNAFMEKDPHLDHVWRKHFHQPLSFCERS